MLRYTGTAAALKVFSIGPGPQLYRRIANTVGNRKRVSAGIGQAYIERANYLLSLLDRYELVDNATRILEVGSGWVHWYGLVVRLAYGIDVDLYDVVDNRQFEAFRRYVAQAPRVIAIPQQHRPAAHALAESIAAAKDFREAYALLGSRYFLRPDGGLGDLASGAYDGVLSFRVLEHVARKAAARSVREYFRILKPGGFSIHQIDMQDHLSLYDRAAHPKQYLSFGERMWNAFYQNEVQYFNRLQKGAWLQYFEDAGFELVHADQEMCSLEGLKHISSSFRRLPRQDLECRVLTVVHRKPQSTRAGQRSGSDRDAGGRG